MRIFLTGHLGYIGSRLLSLLTDHGHDIDGMDLQRGQDIRSQHEAIPAGTHDAVIHLAALASVPESMRQPLRYWEVNTYGTTRLLGALPCRSFRGRLVFASSLAARHPESSPYAATKFAAELMIAAAAKQYGFSAVCLRLANVAGGGDPTPGRLIPEAIRAARESLPLTIHAAPTLDHPASGCWRDYVHVDDVAEAFRLALDSPCVSPGECVVYDVGSGLAHSASTVVEVVEHVSGREVEANRMPVRAGDHAAMVAHVGETALALGWRARRSLLEIVRSEWEIAAAPAARVAS